MSTGFQLSEFLPYLLNQAAERASQDFAQIYKSRFGMQRTDWRVLAHLGEFGALTARDICARAAEHKTRVSRAVSRLEARGFISRRAASSISPRVYSAGSIKSSTQLSSSRMRSNRPKALSP